LYHIPEKKRTANDFPVSGGGLKRKKAFQGTGGPEKDKNDRSERL
jgi:hypothetical protein